ncbi:MAG: LPXTG cell wall anchor domain-containing protein [Clostridiales bacterium]|nr:LPXTG cell wall anchor domain-containing protein [Clostridiales bacterium]
MKPRKKHEKISAMLLSAVLLLSGPNTAIFSEDGIETLAADDVPSQYKLHAVDPDGVSVNMFDYWTWGSDNEESRRANDWSPDKTYKDLNQTDPGTSVHQAGINYGHYLLFRNGSGVNDADDRVDTWNTYIGKASSGYLARQNLVANKLTNGYPTLNITAPSRWSNSYSYFNYGANLNAKESLAYLFDPNMDTGYKESFANVTGLFQIDNATGNYFFDSRKAFAELDETNNRFTLYTEPWIGNEDAPDEGQFFPFNTWSKLFTEKNGVYTQKAIQKAGYGKDSSAGAATYGENLNHYFGMTIEAKFQQPDNGKIGFGDSGESMFFSFSGDDDVWLFIDDVLVADLGGMHDANTFTINFETGAVTYYTNNSTKPHSTTSLPEAFTKAGVTTKLSADGKTFASGTTHTLKMFYLERGGWASNFSTSFNLQPIYVHQIKKVDYSGNPVAGAEFELHAVNDADSLHFTQDHAWITAVDPAGVSANVLSTMTTDQNGIAGFFDADGDPFDFASRSSAYYVLKETGVPEGYRSLTADIILWYDDTTGLLKVMNRYQVGAYSSFVSHIAAKSADVPYGLYQPDTKAVESQTGYHVSEQVQKNGLILAVPMLKTADSSLFNPLYGDNTNGFSAVQLYEGNSVESFRKNLLAAALLQLAHENSPDWYLTYNNSKNILEGTLSDLPGHAERYRLKNSNNEIADGYDMQMIYFLIDPNALQQVFRLNSSAMDDEAKVLALQQILRNNYHLNASQTDDAALRNLIEQIYRVSPTDNTPSSAGITLLNTDDFTREFRSTIYIPNEHREFRVQKVDENGNPLDGALFALFANEEDAKAASLADYSKALSSGTTATVGTMRGTLIFTTSHTDTASGYAHMDWPADAADNTVYYLKEIKAPHAAYAVNETIVPISVGNYGIYADAGQENDGVLVYAGVGKLVQTMSKYASDGDVNITLRDITATAQKQTSGRFDPAGWQNGALDDRGNQSLHLHYGINQVTDYGLHDDDLALTDGGLPFFVTDTGYIRASVAQNYVVHDDPTDPYRSLAAKDNLTGMDITDMFSLVNTVVITNNPAESVLKITKQVDDPALEGDDTAAAEAVKNQLFTFHITLTPPKGEPFGPFYPYLVREPDPETGLLYDREQGEFTPTANADGSYSESIQLKHNQTFVLTGLPEGTYYQITEDAASAAGYRPRVLTAADGGEYAHYQQATGRLLSAEEAVDTHILYVNAKIAPKNLSIEKIVTGYQADLSRDWHFTIKLTAPQGGTLASSYQFTGESAENGVQAPPSGTLIFNNSGEATFTLRHGQRITIKDLPDGTTYQITEQEANTAGYITTTADSGRGLLTDKDQTVTFTNTYNDRLPEAGGNGTALFFIAGGLLLAACWLLMRKRQKNTVYKAYTSFMK